MITQISKMVCSLREGNNEEMMAEIMQVSILKRLKGSNFEAKITRYRLYNIEYNQISDNCESWNYERHFIH